MNALRKEVGLLREENNLLRKGNIAPTASVAVVGSAATAVDGGGGGKNVGPQGRIEPFTTAIKPHVVSGGGTGSLFSAGSPGVLTVQGGTPNQREEGGEVGISQASRDVAALLRKYEGEVRTINTSQPTQLFNQLL